MKDSQLKRFTFSQDLTIQVFENESFLLHHKKYDKRIVVNKNVVEIIETFDTNKEYTIPDIKEVINKRLDLEMSMEEVHVLVHEKLAPLGIVETESIEVNMVNSGDYLSIKIILFNASHVSKVSWIFQFLFTPRVFYISAALMLSFILALIYLDFDVQTFQITTLEATVTSLLVLSGLFFHELGHASACRKFGADHGGIGFGFYMLTPVLFADVTDVWKLKKGQRMIVNLAGVYLQLVLCTLFGILFLFTQSNVAILFVYSTAVTFLFNLNPFLRYDGYWIVSDLLGIYNLKAKSINTFKNSIKSIIQRFRTNLKTKTDYFLFLYGFLSLAFVFVFLGFLIIKSPDSVIYFPKNCYLFFEKLIVDNTDVNFDWVKSELKKLVVPLLFYFILFKMLYQRRLKLKNILKL